MESRFEKMRGVEGRGGGQSIWADKTGFAWDKVISSNMNMRKTEEFPGNFINLLRIT